MSSIPPRFRVAICGGGIGGLCLAVLLSQVRSIQVDVFEAAGQFKEIGAGVMIWSRTWRILGLMGLSSEFSHIAHAPPDGTYDIGFDFRRSDQEDGGKRFNLFELPYGCIRFHRAPFLDVFVRHLPKGVAHFNKRLSSYAQFGKSVILNFVDGTTSTCDLLVGCDGIRSTVRARMLELKAHQEKDSSLLQYVEPVFTGTIAYRGLIDVSAHQPLSGHRAVKSPMMYCGKAKHVVSYSIAQGNVLNVVAFASRSEDYGSVYGDAWVKECSQDEVLTCFAGWEPEVMDILQNIERPTRWAIHHLKPLPFCVSGRVALAGDAAHAMAPHQGAGAGQAIEDAFVLAALFERATLDTLELALQAYQRIRLPAANAVLVGSFESGNMYEFNGEFEDRYGALGPAINEQWSWITATSPEEDADRAIKHFEYAVRSKL